MGHFYFVRHGESVWNIENKICGKTDSPLTQKGHEQAVRTAQEILKQGIRADMILCSPLLRAYATAEHISEICGIPFRTEDRLIEQAFGRFEGTARDGAEFRQAKTRFIDSYGDGETMLKTAHRVYSLLDEITSQEDTVYILAAHNGLARIVESYFRDMTNEEFAAFGLKNCEIRRYDY